MWVCHYLFLITVYYYYIAVTICNTEVNQPPEKSLDLCWKVNSPVHDFRGDYSRNLSSSFCWTNTDYFFLLSLPRKFEFGNICNHSAWLSLVASGLWMPASVRGSRGDLITADLIVWTGPGFDTPSSRCNYRNCHSARCGTQCCSCMRDSGPRWIGSCPFVASSPSTI